MAARQYNHPNWFQPVTVYKPGSAEVLEEFEIAQVWDGTRLGHRRLRRQAVETVERLRDKTGLDYLMWSPITVGGVRILAADKQHVTIG